MVYLPHVSRRKYFGEFVMRTVLVCSVCLTLLLLLAPPLFARTWYIKADGSGDAPTIEAGMDSASAGDIVLVGQGTYYVNTIKVKANITVTSESGPLVTIIEPADYLNVLVAFAAGTNSEVSGFWIKPFTLINITVIQNDNVLIFNNIIETASTAEGIYCDYGSGRILNNLIFGPGTGFWAYDPFPERIYIYNNIILNDLNCPMSQSFDAICNDVIASDPGCINLVFANFSLDPQFCGVPGSNNYYLQEDSPCAPGNHPNGENWCGLIGPLPVGCGTVPVEKMTWGAIKSIYSE